MDVARGLGIILVVYGHVGRGLMSAGIATSPSWQVADFVLYTFHMPAFFMMAGLNVQASLRRGARTFLTKKIATVAYPYLLWSLVHAGFLRIFATYANNPTESDFGVRLLTGSLWHFWFLYVLMAFHIVAAVVLPRRRLLFCVSLGALTSSYFLKDGGTLHALAYNLPFYAAGVLAAPWVSAQRGPERLRRILPLLAWCIFAVVAIFAHAHDPLRPTSVWALPAAIVGCAALFLTAQALQGASILRLLGLLSMSIYLMHVIAAAGVRAGLLHAGVHNVLLHTALGVAIGLAAPCAAHFVLGRLKLLPILGLGASLPAAAAMRPKPGRSPA